MQFIVIPIFYYLLLYENYKSIIIDIRILILECVNKGSETIPVDAPPIFDDEARLQQYIETSKINKSLLVLSILLPI